MMKTLYVNSERVDCVGEAPQRCLQVRETPDGDWRLFYGEIDGFDFEPGYRYTLRVDVGEVAAPPADASSRRYRLVELVEKAPAG